ncbi:MAG: helix-turn-helix domain-containing protein [Curvibacter lanceolatus]|uniref:Mor transcription activator family protein n=1 Tax=Curvibacter lanceolatus TaxID=86182 RepID=UPI00235252D1|nr:Mor transcription activator family protein [Curvibacter lanceolatus]MBV5295508.1 helix-turn-helix domain-containing protein [Curvibacter lanceolatus]
MTPETSTPQPSTTKATPEPDLVDRIFAYLEAELPQALRDVDHLKANIRAEFGGLDWYIPVKPRGASRQRQQEVLRLFNGRNAEEVARQLNINRATVYRVVKKASRR